MNTTKLKSIMVLHGDTNATLSQGLGISRRTLSNKINEKGSEFTRGEIIKIKERYDLSIKEVEGIFLHIRYPKKSPMACKTGKGGESRC